MGEDILSLVTLFWSACCCSQPGSCAKWPQGLTNFGQAVSQNPVSSFQLATDLGQEGRAKQYRWKSFALPCRKHRLIEKMVSFPTAPTSLPPPGAPRQRVWGRCLQRAGFSQGAKPMLLWPACSPEVGRKATAQGAGQVVVTGPHVRLPTLWSPRTPSSFYREETLSSPGTEGEPSLGGVSLFFSGVGVYHPVPLQRDLEAFTQG